MEKLNEIKVKEMMTKSLVTSRPKMIMTEVAEIFESYQFHHVPVLEDGVCVGIISKSDYFQLQDKFTRLGVRVAEVDNKRLFQSLIAQEVMSTEVQFLDENDTMDKALDIFLSNQVHSIIINRNNKCIGILTPYDILKRINQQSYV